MKRLIGSVLEIAADAVPTRLAVTLGEEKLTFLELERRTNRLAHCLSEFGIGRGDRVVVWMSLSIQAIDVFFAIQKLGAAFVPLNPDFSVAEAADMLTYVRPSLLIADPAHGSMAEAAIASSGADPIVLATRGSAHALAEGFNLDRACEQASDRRPASYVEEDDVQAIFLTSGSTGKPKGVMLSHRASWLRATYGSGSSIVASGGGGELCMFPLFHFAGWVFLTNACATLRATHLATDTRAETLLSMIELHHPANLYCIPAVWERILDCRHPYDLSSLRSTNTGTSRVEPELIRRIRERFPQTSNSVMYGSTEFGGALGLAHGDIDRKPYSVGLPKLGVAARIEDGELCLQGDTMMSGYYSLPQETEAVLKDGWFYTGDLADRDDEGYFTICGRRREIIRTGGETVAPVEVEAALASFAGVADSAVVGIPDAKWGELVCAVLVLEEGARVPSVEDLRRHVAGSLAAFKHPRKVCVIESLPRTAATGQIQRSRIAELIARESSAS